MDNPTSWRLRSPGDLLLELDLIQSGSVENAIDAATRAFDSWRRLPVEARWQLLSDARTRLEAEKERLAVGIALETGKPIREARGEMDAVVSKFDLTYADAQRYCQNEEVQGVHEAKIRHRPRGPAAVIGPFNFPIHLANGAILAHLLGGNPVVFKPSPLAANCAGHYARILQECLPQGVFNLVQGGAEHGWAVCTDPRIRAVAFTGSVPVGRKLATALIDDLGKDVALELGGKNAVLVCQDADLDLAARSVAEATCLTAGQRCNATSRVIVHSQVLDPFLERLIEQLNNWQPGFPLETATMLGPLVSEAAVLRYRRAVLESSGDWIFPGRIPENVQGRSGYYVGPALLKWHSPEDALRSPIFKNEIFAPVVGVVATQDDAAMISLANATTLGLSVSIFTRSSQRFYDLADDIQAGNVYANLPTTYSPSTLPFGGWKDSGNRHPGGRGFIRFVTDEQAIQVGQGTLIGH